MVDGIDLMGNCIKTRDTKCRFVLVDACVGTIGCGLSGRLCYPKNEHGARKVSNLRVSFFKVQLALNIVIALVLNQGSQRRDSCSYLLYSTAACRECVNSVLPNSS